MSFCWNIISSAWILYTNPDNLPFAAELLDVFSYSNDLPFRIEFFGDEVDSIRTFDPVDQLSQKTHDFFNIIPNVQGSFLQGRFHFFPELLGRNATVWLSSHNMVSSVLGKEYEKAVKIYEGT